ncbi:PAQR family membrane homeostasis protein TrhA [Anaerolentibacter hominis]|uniref:PAQR family membrane homeostasis protein TrhA n=1 Tax=Anaerolentibacter hominis TaxID=3079009 RepID=UPI0031B857A2
MELRIKDPGSAITHFIAMVGAIFAAIPLLIRAASSFNPTKTASLGIFMLSMVLLYGASTVYHTFDRSEKVNRVLKKLDHSMIFILITGTYTPVCLIALKGPVGYTLLAFVWAVAIIGIVIKLFFVYCPKWVSSVLYIALGWACVFAMAPITRALPKAAFGWLLAGGIIYTVGGVIYALKMPLFNSRHKNFGTHEIFHLFCMGGSFCHFMLMYLYLAKM